MINRLITLALAVALSCTAFARNTITRISQVTSQVEVSGNVDYTITHTTTPFAVTGGLNITNTEHAVVILENIRPSEALAYLPFIKINGEDAVNDETCQVKMYAHGSIILPYSKDIKPLTVYSEQNYGGESVNDFGLENSGGFMNTLTTAKLNNRIRSFKLKRGYMVTFSNNARGRGYSRCFIANDADLEFATLPAELDKKISSYRIFKWYDAEKKGIANDTRYESTHALNVSWCYSFGPGEDRGMDCECVPHRIHEGWPSPSECGSRTYSPHMKTNNEPGNKADPDPCSVDDILRNWEELMATGMRLCSPSSHDGSLNHLWAFMDSIDARGWRCDILDIHSYWTEGSFYQLSGWYNKYKRPIWISEWVWGASWNNNGAFASNNRNDNATYNGTLPILNLLNKWDYVERYAYWNSEQWYTNIYRDGGLTKLGQYYSTMKSGMAYKKSYEYVPKYVCVAPKGLTLSYDKTSKTLQLSWTNPNMELSDSSKLELRIGDGEWTTVALYPSSELTQYSYKTTFDGDFESGLYTYRIHNYDVDKTERYSNEAYVTLTGSEGSGDFQYGSMEIANTDDQTGYFKSIESSIPYVFVGLSTYNNKTTGLVNNLKKILSENFTFRYFPWAYGNNSADMTKSEHTDFMVISPELKKIGNLTFELGDAGRIKNENTRVNFATPFPEGITPVVFAYVNTTSTVHPYMVKISNITNEGFDVKLSRQAKENETQSSFVAQKVYYVAATPGQTILENGKLLTIGTSPENLIDGVRDRPVYFTDADNEQFKLLNPYILCGSQTDNYDCASIYRINTSTGYITETAIINNETVEVTKGIKVLRQKDDTNTTAPTDRYTINGDIMGWMIVSDPTEPGSSIREHKEEQVVISVHNNRISVDGCDNYNIYTLNGTLVPRETILPQGVYIVKAGKQVEKILIP